MKGDKLLERMSEY